MHKRESVRAGKRRMRTQKKRKKKASLLKGLLERVNRQILRENKKRKKKRKPLSLKELRILINKRMGKIKISRKNLSIINKKRIARGSRPFTKVQVERVVKKFIADKIVSNKTDSGFSLNSFLFGYFTGIPINSSSLIGMMVRPSSVSAAVKQDYSQPLPRVWDAPSETSRRGSESESPRVESPGERSSFEPSTPSYSESNSGGGFSPSDSGSSFGSGE